jgi:hypothetical protein
MVGDLIRAWLRPEGQPLAPGRDGAARVEDIVTGWTGRDAGGPVVDGQGCWRGRFGPGRDVCVCVVYTIQPPAHIWTPSWALLSWSRYSRHIYKATTKIGCWDADGEERLCTGMLVRHAGAEAGSLDQVGAGQGCLLYCSLQRIQVAVCCLSKTFFEFTTELNDVPHAQCFSLSLPSRKTWARPLVVIIF